MATTMPIKNQLFIIGVDAWKASSIEEVEATCAVLKQVGAYALPYESLDLDIPADEYVCWIPKEGEKPSHPGVAEALTQDGRRCFKSNIGPSCVVRFEGLSLTGEPAHSYIIDNRSGFKEDISAKMLGQLKERNDHMCNLLIALLATRNATKEVRHSKLGKLGIGKRKDRYEYTTTIGVPTAPEMEDDEEHPATGGTKCPHLRRAHVRNTPYGPGHALRRPKLIPAVFVNADREWTKTRVGYNVSL